MQRGIFKKTLFEFKLEIQIKVSFTKKIDFLCSQQICATTISEFGFERQGGNGLNLSAPRSDENWSTLRRGFCPKKQRGMKSWIQYIFFSPRPHYLDISIFSNMDGNLDISRNSDILIFPCWCLRSSSLHWYCEIYWLILILILRDIFLITTFGQILDPLQRFLHLHSLHFTRH